MLGKRWTNAEIARSIQISPENFITLEEFERMTKQFTVITKDTPDFRKNPELLEVKMITETKTEEEEEKEEKKE
jgi:hypothetical protein